MKWNILPPIPSDQAERKAFVDTWTHEISVLRRRPSFIVGLALAALSAFTIIALTDGWIARVAVIIGVFGVAAVYDTVTRHFCGELIKRGAPSSHAPAAGAPPQPQVG